jgi:hypothetical protein
MIRAVLTEVAVFLVPFVAYALFLAATRAGVFSSTSWPAPLLLRLGLVAALLVILSLVLLANFSGAPPESTYEPARLENGRLVPGSEK